MLRAPSRSPIVQLIARLLIVALVAAAIPTDAIASLPVGEASKLTKSAFGELLAHTGSDPQPYAFTGEPYDPNVGFQYHRARWMDPSLGRFTAADRYPSLEADPATLHRYLYASDNPATLRDPTGFFASVAELSVVNGIVSLLRGQQVQFGVDYVTDRLFADNPTVQVVSAAVGVAGAVLAVSSVVFRLIRSPWLTKFLVRRGWLSPNDSFMRHDSAYTISRHTLSGAEVQRDLRRGREAHVFNDDVDLDALASKAWDHYDGSYGTDGRDQWQRWLYESPTPIGRRIQNGRADVSLRWLEIKARLVSTPEGRVELEYHLVPRARPGEP